VSDGRVVLSGEIDLANKEAVDRQLAAGAEQALQDGRLLEVDLSAVTFLDSTGLACMARAAQRMADAGGHLRVLGAQAMIRRVFEIAGLGDLCDD
jgi:anti-anti-sigma factor